MYFLLIFRYFACSFSQALIFNNMMLTESGKTNSDSCKFIKSVFHRCVLQQGSPILRLRPTTAQFNSQESSCVCAHTCQPVSYASQAACRYAPAYHLRKLSCTPIHSAATHKTQFPSPPQLDLQAIKFGDRCFTIYLYTQRERDPYTYKQKEREANHTFFK